MITKYVFEGANDSDSDLNLTIANANGSKYILTTWQADSSADAVPVSRGGTGQTTAANARGPDGLAITDSSDELNITLQDDSVTVGKILTTAAGTDGQVLTRTASGMDWETLSTVAEVDYDASASLGSKASGSGVSTNGVEHTISTPASHIIVTVAEISGAVSLTGSNNITVTPQISNQTTDATASFGVSESLTADGDGANSTLTTAAGIAVLATPDATTTIRFQINKTGSNSSTTGTWTATNAVIQHADVTTL